ncbi:MAG: hypothetical protein AAGD35_14455, partial [Actinomycetota bacterium]
MSHPPSAAQPPNGAPSVAIVVGPGTIDRSDNGPRAQAEVLGLDVGPIHRFRLVHLRGDLDDDQIQRLADELLLDPVGGWWAHAADAREGVPGAVVQEGLRPGVTHREGAEL